jgi:hypothetical protein
MVEGMIMTSPSSLLGDGRYKIEEVQKHKNYEPKVKVQ